MGGPERKASGTGAETAPEILVGPSGERLGTPPRSLGTRVAGAAAGAVAGGAAGRALRPVARRAAGRFGLPAGVVVRGVEILAPIVVSSALARLARRRARGKAGSGASVPPAASAPPRP
ncbi:hypothetical protein [Actinomadura viridis]|uniref:Uncharacterized protein n=1 Tax=Actinomadura viridis TaxID=58110 RepID=A0A931DEM8_9ACTN|nr:hypothetical protein [Actinomadura viridis]MBG6087429.1 hypothetical protein [Actinomadura viridis]